MHVTLKLEEACKFIVAYLFCLYAGFSTWMFLLFLLLPDIGMLGYLINSRVGAFLYNVFHHQGLALCVVFTGFYMALPNVLFAGIILFAHSAMDRVLGYGLKYSDSFKHTHLGYIGREKN